MQIDWLTVAAQALNFLVLVFLLQRFLYRPVIAAMARREAHIAQRLLDAEQRETEAASQRSEYEARTREIESRSSALEAEARAHAEAERERMLEAARREVQATEARWRAELEHERQDSRQALRHELAASALAIARRGLSDLADARVEERAIDVFIERLDASDEADLGALRSADAKIVVATAFEPDRAAMQRIVDALHRRIGAEVDAQFTTSPDLVLGVELRAAGRSIGWSMSDFLEQVEARIAERLAGEAELARTQAAGG